MKCFKNSLSYIGLISILLAGCGGTSSLVGGEGGEGGENGGLHYQGRNCMDCHSFSSGGTVFKTLNASNNDLANSAAGYNIRLALKDSVGNTTGYVYYVQGRGDGNFNTSWINGGAMQFIAEVVDSNGKVVNKSASLHNQSRFACNSCHTASGTGGAPGRIVSYDYYASLNNTGNTGGNTTGNTTGNTGGNTTAVSFASSVYPVLKQKCQACHNSTSGRIYKVLSTAAATYTNLTSNSLVNTTTPANSLLLQKGGGKISHTGGNALGTSYNTVLNWIQQGAKNN